MLINSDMEDFTERYSKNKLHAFYSTNMTVGTETALNINTEFGM
jgi:hypothetical protein